jgi:DNA-binding SARP family transcriptional activator
MSRLAISLFGHFQVTLDSEEISDFRYDKVRALLAYLAVYHNQPFRRQSLAALLWPDVSHQSAFSNLRNAIYYLRNALEGSHRPASNSGDFLMVGKGTLQFRKTENLQLDVAEFEKLLALEFDSNLKSSRQIRISNLEAAVALYDGGFLDGFYVDSPAFEEWLLFERHRLKESMLTALDSLATFHEDAGDLIKAQHYIRWQLRLEPYRETAHQCLMRVLALGGQRGAAMDQYNSCRHILAQELGVAPSGATLTLFRQIRNGEHIFRNDKVVTGSWPDLTVQDTHHVIAREAELSRLDGHLDMVFAGQGKVTFVTGSLGSGKTALLESFTRRTLAQYSDVVVVGSSCAAHRGIGEPYLPFLEILHILSGDIESRRQNGTLLPEQANRLWELWPATMQTLIDDGPGLVGSMLPTKSLLLSAQTFTPDAPWVHDLQRLARKESTLASSITTQQGLYFEQIIRVLSSLTRLSPLILLLDDLQWADDRTLSLLFHLGRRLDGLRLLVIGAYRPADLDSQQCSQDQSIDAIAHELQRTYGDISINLDLTQTPSFVNLYLTGYSHRLSPDFSNQFFRYTGANALFTVELFQDLLINGGLVQDGDGRWIESNDLTWNRIPHRLEAAISEKLECLPVEWMMILEAASVEGEEFTAEVLACATDQDVEQVLEYLSGPLSRGHNLVEARSVFYSVDSRFSRYRFKQVIIQQYIYNQLDIVQRSHLHRAIGTALENLLNEDKKAIDAQASQLASHFEAAGLVFKAVEYLLRAGHLALRRNTTREAAASFKHGLDLLAELPDADDFHNAQTSFGTSRSIDETIRLLQKSFALTGP